MKERNKENVTAIYTVIRANGKKETIKGAGGFTLNYNKIRYALMARTGVMLVTIFTTNFDFNPMNNPLKSLYLGSPEGYIGFGLVVGTNGEPYSYEDYKIDLIGHGSETGRLNYSATTVRMVPPDMDVLEVKRQFRNQSNSGVTVRESGLIVLLTVTDVSTNILIARDVPDSPILLNPGDTLIVTYNLKV